MGARGVSPFDDDAARDFIDEIVEARDMQVIADAVYCVPDADDQYVDSATAVCALVAAEVIVIQFARESGDVPDEIHEWIDDQDDPDQALIERTRRAVKRVLRDSGLRDHWKESQSYPEWKVRTEGLLKRLS